MNVYISYFYQIRFFPKNLLPVSTAAWDPKWFHEGMGPQHSFMDKRGIINGLRIPELSPAAVPEVEICQPNCQKDYKTCGFLKWYRKCLHDLDFDAVMRKLEETARNAATPDNKNMDICLIVYETPSNPCSERVPIVGWFAEHGVNVKEFEKPA